MAQDFQNLTVWQRAMELAETIYALAKTFPPDEMYGLSTQLRRASVSIAATSPKGAGAVPMASSAIFCTLRKVPPAKWRRSFCWHSVSR